MSSMMPGADPWTLDDVMDAVNDAARGQRTDWPWPDEFQQALQAVMEGTMDKGRAVRIGRLVAVGVRPFG